MDWKWLIIAWVFGGTLVAIGFGCMAWISKQNLRRDINSD